MTNGRSLDELIEHTPDMPWLSRAACGELDLDQLDLFFVEAGRTISSATVSLCQQCPVRRECLDTAVANREPAGVWGGHLFVDGRIVLQKRRRGRPPRQARPEDSFPPVELPDAYRWLVARSGPEPART